MHYASAPYNMAIGRESVELEHAGDLLLSRAKDVYVRVLIKYCIIYYSASSSFRVKYINYILKRSGGA